jgi:hypothetical protein
LLIGKNQSFIAEKSIGFAIRVKNGVKEKAQNKRDQ